MISTKPIEIYRAAQNDLNIVCKKDGAILDITGGTLTMVAKYRLEDADGSALFSLVSPTNITITSAANGAATIFIPASATSSLPDQLMELQYSIRLLDSGGKVRILATGPLRIFPICALT